MLKSLDDINLYLEKKFSQKKFQQNNKTIEEENNTIINERIKNNSEPDVKTFPKNLNDKFYLLDNKYSYLNLNRMSMTADL